MSMQPILDALPDGIRSALAAAMMAKGATSEKAAEAVTSIERALADWLLSGGHAPLASLPDSTVRVELKSLADAAKELHARIERLSIDAKVRLLVSLQGEKRGPWSRLMPPSWNPDPIEIEAPPRGLLSAARRARGEPPERIVIPANLSATFSRFQLDLDALVEPIQRGARFKLKKSANEPLKHLFRQAIHAWREATNEWPSAGSSAGYDDDPGRAASPIPGALREMAAAILGEAPRAMNDRAFLRALASEKESPRPPKSSGLLMRARVESTKSPRRGRPQKKDRKSTTTD